jgi:CubicO group peptidase (beta-lactamase class C family)/uncharacterized protein (DUF302 family)
MNRVLTRILPRSSASILALGLALSVTSAHSWAGDASTTDTGRAQTVLAVRSKYIDERIANFMTKNNVPGLSMAIVQAPYIPRSASYGRASIVNDQLAATRTMWNVGPITQGFTAVAVFQLYEAGKLNIHDAVGKYLADIPEAWRKVTIFELLQHASGIPDYRGNPDYNPDKVYRPAELLAMSSSKPLLFAPGTQVRLSATNFALLGMVIERTSGMSFHDYITKYQIEPLGLHSTMFAEDFATKASIDRPAQETLENEHVKFKSEAPFIDPVEPAIGYSEKDGKLMPADPKSSESLFGFGSLWSSAEDISIWDIGLAGSVLVKNAENRALIYEPTKLENGTVVPAMAGWEFTHHPGFMEVKGNAPGFSGYLSRFTAPSELVCVTLLANKEGVDLTDLARDIAEAYKAGLGAPIDTDRIVTQESKYSVDETATRLQAQLAVMNIPVFAVFDHADNAKKAGLTLRPTKVIVFGNAKVGTKLMLDNQAIAIDLPLRVSIWQDERTRVWVSYHSLDRLADQYGIKDAATVQALDYALEKLVDHAVNVYDY